MNNILELNLTDSDIRTRVLSIENPSSPDTLYDTIITCRLSNMLLSDLEDPNLTIQLITNIIFMPYRKHKKKRIQKKWIKKYGQHLLNQESDYRVLYKEVNFQEDTVEFRCEIISINNKIIKGE